MRNRIKELREQRGWTQGQLAEAVTKAGHKTSTATIQKLEVGMSDINTRWITRLADAFRIDTVEVLFDINETEISTNCQQVNPANASTAQSATRLQALYFRITGPELTDIGIKVGDTLQFDVDPNGPARQKIGTGDAVVAKVFCPVKKSEVLVMRQFVEPQLLITNSRERNLKSIRIHDLESGIVGVAMTLLFNPKVSTANV